MIDQKFRIYSSDYSSMSGSISNGCLHLESYIDGDGFFPDMEKHYGFSFADTQKLFEMISLDELFTLCRKDYSFGLETFLENNGICPMTFVI